MTTAIDNQIYDQLANTWWDENEFLHLLKSMVNPWCMPYFKTTLNEYHGEDLRGICLLDAGCGGGVLAEEFASMGRRLKLKLNGNLSLNDLDMHAKPSNFLSGGI